MVSSQVKSVEWMNNLLLASQFSLSLNRIHILSEAVVAVVTAAVWMEREQKAMDILEFHCFILINSYYHCLNGIFDAK